MRDVTGNKTVRKTDHGVQLRELRLFNLKMTRLVYVCTCTYKAEPRLAAEEITATNEKKK